MKNYSNLITIHFFHLIDDLSLVGDKRDSLRLKIPNSKVNIYEIFDSEFLVYNNDVVLSEKSRDCCLLVLK